MSAIQDDWLDALRNVLIFASIFALLPSTILAEGDRLAHEVSFPAYRLRQVLVCLEFVVDTDQDPGLFILENFSLELCRNKVLERSNKYRALQEATRSRGAANSGGLWKFYTEDSTGLKIGPVPVLVLSLVFIASVFVLHIWGKYTRSH
uniref:PH domain-containing protein n=1 Tax=Panagrellus redivivus TaxID=6233 RepID=A0A7E4V4T9_PANRE